MAPPVIDLTPAGPQHVLPGAERALQATMAQRGADAPLRPRKPQKPAAGLFEGNSQLDIIDAIRKATA